MKALREIRAIGKTRIGDICFGLCRAEISAIPFRYVEVVDFCKAMIPLQQVLENMGLLDPPKLSKKSATWASMFPPQYMQHICWLAGRVSCKSLTEQDGNGWNLLHHIFHCAVQSTLVCNISSHMASSQFPMLDGDMRRAVRQVTTRLLPLGCTPVHFLCTGRDTTSRKKDLIKGLLDARVLLITDFDVPDEKVIYFFNRLVSSRSIHRLPAKRHTLPGKLRTCSTISICIQASSQT